MINPPAVHLALIGTERIAPTAKEAIAWARAAGARGVRLDAARDGLRPRQLDRSARRDLAAMLRREGLTFAGLDLFIPPEHFARADTAERATDALRAALRLAADLDELAGDGTGRTVAAVLPAEAAAGVASALQTEAEASGAAVCDCGWPAAACEGRTVLAGIDPPAVLLAGESPAKALTRAGDRLAHARLADLSASGRCAVGDPGGRLDVTAYAAAAAVAGLRGVTLDVRGVADPDRAVSVGLERWARALTIPGT